jgi:hypothetical protein
MNFKDKSVPKIANRLLTRLGNERVYTVLLC